ncbi:MAG: ketoacyl-ACP synthase III [Bacteriovoracaceae bacterium]|nr:ketoacyl-ACP synthase III [Bacteriovoracaceae bacterium]
MGLHSKIIGTGSYVPPNKLTNFDLEAMLDTSDEWIQQRSGIITRYWVDAETCTSDLAFEASKIAIEKSGLKTSDIDMIVFATITPDHDFPGCGVFLQRKLGLPGIACLDIRQACSGFIYALAIADNFIKGGTHKNILVVGAEIHSKGMDKTPEGRNISVLFGDGAGACVVSACDVQKPAKDPHVINTFLHADGTYAEELWLPGPGSNLGPDRFSQDLLDRKLHYPEMKGKTVFVHAIKRMCEVLEESINASQYSLDDIDIFLFHQANMRINSKVAEILKLPESKVFNTIQDFGNTTAATIPIGMDVALRDGVLKPGMLVGSAAFGSGFAWASGLWRM